MNGPRSGGALAVAGAILVLTGVGCRKTPPASAEAEAKVAAPSPFAAAPVPATEGASAVVAETIGSPGRKSRRLPGEKVVRNFEDLSAPDRTAFRRLETEYWSAKDPLRRQEILAEIDGSFYGPEVLPLAAKILGAGDEEMSLAAVGLLAGNTSASILPVLEIALRDPSAEVRQQAVLAASQVRDDSLLGFFGHAFADADPDVRLSAFNALDDQSRERRLKVLAQGLEAAFADVQTMAVDSLQMESTPRSAEVLFGALDSRSAEVREAARFALEFKFDQVFPNAAAARTWWEANRGNYDQDLAPR